VGSNKKNNTAVKDEQDFASDVLAEELQGVLKSVPDQDAHEFFNALKNEMLDEEGVNLENSVVHEAPEFTAFDITPDDLKDKASAQVEASVQVDVVDKADAKNEESATDIWSEEDFKAESKIEPEAKVKGEQIKEAVQAPIPQDDVNTARVFEDKTSAVDEYKKPYSPNIDDKTQDLSNLENVASLEMAKAQKFQHLASRNPSIDLKNADYIKFAQGKIKNLEKELSNLRVETQELALAGSHFKSLADEREQRNKSLEAKVSEVQSTSIEEKKILNAALEAKDTKISLLQERVEGLEVELESKYNRLRVRERELESRLEILKQEQDAVASSKDDLILRVKKQNNVLSADLDRARSQAQKNSTLLQEKEDALRRTIKALKLSLTMLESHKKT